MKRRARYAAIDNVIFAEFQLIEAPAMSAADCVTGDAELRPLAEEILRTGQVPGNEERRPGHHTGRETSPV